MLVGGNLLLTLPTLILNYHQTIVLSLAGDRAFGTFAFVLVVLVMILQDLGFGTGWAILSLLFRSRGLFGIRRLFKLFRVVILSTVAIRPNFLDAFPLFAIRAGLVKLILILIVFRSRIRFIAVLVFVLIA